MAGERQSSYQEVVLTFLLYAFFNIFLNWWNSWAQQPHSKEFKIPIVHLSSSPPCGGFTFPFFYSFFHTISSVLGAMVLMRIRPPASGWPTFAQMMEYKCMITPIAACHVVNIGLNNASLVTVSLFVNQVINSLAPFPTMIAEKFFFKQNQSWPIILSVVVLCTGAAMSIKFDNSTSSQAIGIICVIIATVASALKPVFASIVMKGGDKPKLEPSLILFYEQCVAMVLMGIVTIADFPNLKEAIDYFGTELAWEGYMIIIVGSTAAFIYNLSIYYFTRAASALAVMIASNLIKVLLIALSAMQTGVDTVVQLLGIIIFFFGVCAYAYLSYRKKKKQVSAPKASLEAGLKTKLNETTQLVGSEASAKCCVIS